MPFDDPPDDDDVTITETDNAIFYRLTVAGRKMSSVLEIEPSLLAVALVARNTAFGCWFALTSRRVAERIVRTLIDDHNIGSVIVAVDHRGVPLGQSVSNADVEAAWQRLRGLD